jgi:hypothetical protein
MAKGKTSIPAQRLQVFHAHKKLKWTAHQFQRYYSLGRGQVGQDSSLFLSAYDQEVDGHD